MKKGTFAFVWMLVLITICTSCSNSQAVPVSEQRKMTDLGNEFVAELNTDYLFIRDDLDELLKQDAVIVTDEKTYQIEKLLDFYDEYRIGNDASLISVFKHKSFVVTKVVFEGNKGYYFRFEYDPFNESDIVVTSQSLDKLEIEKDTRLKKVELTLIKEKKTPVVFSYKHVVDSELLG